MTAPLHKPGQCNGWRPGRAGVGDCAFCRVTKNAATKGASLAPDALAVARHRTGSPANPNHRRPPEPGGPRLTSLMVCDYLGDPLPNQSGCGCQEKLRTCHLHGTCTTRTVKPGVKCCETCGDFRSPAPDTDGWRRHLLYYVYPVSGNGVWQRNIDQLRRRLDLFNGRRVVAVSVDSSRHALDSADRVRDYLGRDAADYLYVPHGARRLGEVTAFVDLWKRVRQFQSDRDVTFYGHAKGVTKPVNPGVSVHRWTDLMYKANLDHWPDVRRTLETHPITGAFKKTGRAFGGRCQWHYTGTFYWCRNRDVFSRAWSRLYQLYGGTEIWPGSLFNSAEGGCHFYDGAGYVMYDMRELERAEACYREWPARVRLEGSPAMADGLRNAIANPPPVPPLSGRGVLTETSPDYHAGTYVLIRMLRHVGSDLPVQVWAIGEVPECIAALPGVEVRRHKPRPTPRKWGEGEYRTDAILHCGFAEVIVLGSDAYPVADPSCVFDDLKHSGVVAWPEGPGDEVYPFFPRVFGMTDAAATWTVQADVQVLDVRKAWAALNGVHWMNLRNGYFRHFGWLDQSYWRAALHHAGILPRVYGPVQASEPFGAFLHPGPGLSPLFVHRSCAKMLPSAPVAPIPGLPLEDVAWGYFSEFDPGAGGA